MSANAACMVASVLLAAATFVDDRFPVGVPIAWLALALSIATLFAIGWWGPTVETRWGLTVHVTAQKAAAIAGLVVLTYQTYQAERVWRGQEARTEKCKT
jgi:hypothetical protein